MQSKTVLDVWVVDLTFPGYMDWWAARAAEFEERHPEYTVAITALGFFTAPREIAAAVADGRVPAVAEYYFYLNQVARDMRTPDGAPLYASLEKALGGRTEVLGEPVVADDVIPALRDYYTFGGELLSMPSVGTTSVLYGNTDALEAAGVAEMPRTWAEVRAACEALAARPGGPEHGVTWSNHGMFFQQAVASAGGALTDHGNGRTGRATAIDLATPEMLAWATWWQEMHGAGHYLDTGGIPDWQQTFQAFAERRTGLRLSSSNDVNYTVQAAGGSGFGLAVGPYPYDDRRPYAGNAVAGSSLWLADGLDEPVREGALAFLQYVHGPRIAADRHRDNSFLPLTHAAYALLDEDGWFAANPHHRVPSDMLAGPPSRGAVYGDFAGIQDVMTRAMADVLAGRADVGASFAAATREAQRLLDAYNAGAPGVFPGGAETLRVEFFTDAKAYSGADMDDVARAERR
ncbi:extracellular solute-binding protein [Actinomadura flavalba]|uniref:extracellular solute-binding protein n=1 Tax=Actinomadura flavalba TaxID=1120938 RepID=UPI00036E8546|nr:extracellular solute-binding protein [Actinomadura flavalba]